MPTNNPTPNPSNSGELKPASEMLVEFFYRQPDGVIMEGEVELCLTELATIIKGARPENLENPEGYVPDFTAGYTKGYNAGVQAAYEALSKVLGLEIL